MLECLKRCGRNSRSGSNYCQECWDEFETKIKAKREAPLSTSAIVGVGLILLGIVTIAMVIT